MPTPATVLSGSAGGLQTCSSPRKEKLVKIAQGQDEGHSLLWAVADYITDCVAETMQQSPGA